MSFAFLSRYLWAVKLPPQNSAGAKNLGGDQLPVNARLVRANNQWGMNKTPTDYSFTLYFLYFFKMHLRRS
ncbi:hypothetical protein BW898_06785 [Bacillus cereus]|nr:hypothetical protein BW898_06785 [Bacillus cereus]